jgi:hypothetical protein
MAHQAGAQNCLLEQLEGGLAPRKWRAPHEGGGAHYAAETVYEGV